MFATSVTPSDTRTRWLSGGICSRENFVTFDLALRENSGPQFASPIALAVARTPLTLAGLGGPPQQELDVET